MLLDKSLDSLISSTYFISCKSLGRNSIISLEEWEKKCCLRCQDDAQEIVRGFEYQHLEDGAWCLQSNTAWEENDENKSLHRSDREDRFQVESKLTQGVERLFKERGSRLLMT